MSVLFPRAGVTPDELADAARRLAGDLALLASGAQPSPDALADAPILDWWTPAQRTTGALMGLVSGHPRIARGHTGLTTELFAIDPVFGWARTWSRFYRLGRPVDVDLGRRQ